MNAKERIAAVLHQARVNGGWIDEDVAAVILSDLSLDDDGKQADSCEPGRA
jgi:hypothetical protein